MAFMTTFFMLQHSATMVLSVRISQSVTVTNHKSQVQSTRARYGGGVVRCLAVSWILYHF